MRSQIPVIATGVPDGPALDSDRDAPKGCERTALSVTTIGSLLDSIQGSALIIGLPDVLTGLHADFLTMIRVLLAYLLVTTALVPVIGGGLVPSPVAAAAGCRGRRLKIPHPPSV